MATRKNNWLNAKPVSKTGGKSGGARNPAKPYSKPPAKTKPKPSTKKSTKAPEVKTKTVTRTGPVKGPVAPKGSTGPITMPNSKRAGVNLPKAGVRAERAATGAMQPRSPMPKVAPKPAPNAAGGLRGAMGRLGRLAGPIGLGITGADLAEQAGFARGGKNYREFTRAQDKPPAKPSKPVKNDPNGRSSRGVNTPNGRTVATGSQQYNDYRNKQIADNRERLKDVGNPPAGKPKPPTPTQDRGGNNPPRRQPGPASDAGMKNQDKNYRGNLFEKTFGYKKGEAPDQIKARREANTSKPEDKSRYVARDGRPYAGPAYGSGDQKSATGKSIGGSKTPAQKAKEDSKPMSYAEKLRRRRMGLS